METTNMPRNIQELKQIILEVVSEMNKDLIPYVSDTEQKEIEELSGDKLYEEYNPKDCVRL